MTRGEFRAWMSHTLSSSHRWVVDPIHNGKDRDLIAHIGGVDGFYITLYEGRGSIGRYEGAIPHICDALFDAPTWDRKFSSNKEAWEYIVSCDPRLLDQPAFRDLFKE